jgi:hypothetical protein
MLLVVAPIASPANGTAAEKSPARQTDEAIRPQDPFYAQLKGGNDWYIRNTIRENLDALQQVHNQLAPQAAKVSAGTDPRSTDADLVRHTGDLQACLDAGEASEAAIARPVEEIIQFHDRHNARMETLAAGDAAKDEFFGPLKMKADQVRELRDAEYSDWPLHPPLWSISAIRSGRRDHEIPRDGLRLDYGRWLERATKTEKRYAFFYFLRKACEPAASGAADDFVQAETGCASLWNVRGEPVLLRRWRHRNFYVYDFIPAQSCPQPSAGSVASVALESCSWNPAAGDLATFYQNKRQWWGDVASEMDRSWTISKNAGPYLEFYSFLGRSFPCISAFRAQTTAPAGYAFVDGYNGDRPAQRSLDVNSPLGIAFRLYQKMSAGLSDEQRQRCAAQLLLPIALLQFRLSPQEQSPTRFPYLDLKVGYDGYLDFCRELIGPQGFVQRGEQP